MWREAPTTGQREIDAAIASLPNTAGKTGREVGAAYKQLIQDIEATKPLEAKNAALDRAMETLGEERANIIAELSDLRRERAGTLQKEVTELNRRLKGKLRIAVRPENDRAPLMDFLVACKLERVGESRLA